MERRRRCVHRFPVVFRKWVSDRLGRSGAVYAKTMCQLLLLLLLLVVVAVLLPLEVLLPRVSPQAVVVLLPRDAHPVRRYLCLALPRPQHR